MRSLTLTARLFPGSLTIAALVATLAAGCSGLQSYVDTDDAALGRVVVYRNGIAYFEWRAHVEGDRLSLRVPHDKVDDFLKSLTVTDVRTGKLWPVSFPTRAAASDGTVEMVVKLPESGSGDVVLSYITEAPSWKPSYRLVVEDDGKVKVQGWAVVDNTSGEDWESVRLGVGSSSALSFRFDLRSIRLVHRETLTSDERFAKAPPRGGSVVAPRAPARPARSSACSPTGTSPARPVTPTSSTSRTMRGPSPAPRRRRATRAAEARTAPAGRRGRTRMATGRRTRAQAHARSSERPRHTSRRASASPSSPGSSTEARVRW